MVLNSLTFVKTHTQGYFQYALLFNMPIYYYKLMDCKVLGKKRRNVYLLKYLSSALWQTNIFCLVSNKIIRSTQFVQYF